MDLATEAWARAIRDKGSRFFTGEVRKITPEVYRVNMEAFLADARARGLNVDVDVDTGAPRTN